MYLYIGCNSHVSAIDPNSGQEVWRTVLETGFFGAAIQDVCLLEDEGKVFAGSYGHLLR